MAFSKKKAEDVEVKEVEAKEVAPANAAKKEEASSSGKSQVELSNEARSKGDPNIA